MSDTLNAEWLAWIVETSKNPILWSKSGRIEEWLDKYPQIQLETSQLGREGRVWDGYKGGEEHKEEFRNLERENLTREQTWEGEARKIV